MTKMDIGYVQTRDPTPKAISQYYHSYYSLLAWGRPKMLTSTSFDLNVYRLEIAIILE